MTPRRWEAQEAAGLSLRHIDRNEVARVVRLMDALGRCPEPPRLGVASVLDRLGLRRNGKLLRAAAVLFGKSLPEYPQCALRVVRAGLNDREIRGSAFKLFAEAEQFLRLHATAIEGAARELVVNALVHRDYARPEGIAINVFEDRLEVVSPGVPRGRDSTAGIPSGIPASPGASHGSLVRNPVLGDVFYRAGFLTRWGGGLELVAEACAEMGARRSVEFADECMVVRLHLPPPRRGRTSPGVGSGWAGVKDNAVTRHTSRRPGETKSPGNREDDKGQMRRVSFSVGTDVLYAQQGTPGASLSACYRPVTDSVTATSKNSLRYQQVLSATLPRMANRLADRRLVHGLRGRAP